VTLSVTDDDGETATASRQVDVSAAAAFPAVPAGALIYVRVSERERGAISRYVLYEDSTFGLQYLSARSEFFEYTGRYARVNASISLDFDANRPQWQATATIQGDSLVVTYNRDMMLSDFEDGVYRLARTPGPAGIYLAGVDGSNPRRLVSGERPAWSPDGRRIAFQRGGDVYLIGIDGTGETLLGEGREPAWHPDGTRLAFTSAEGIAVMREDGSGATTLVHHDFRDDTYAESDQGVGKPAWSPDGDRIAFEHLGDGDLVPAQIFVMSADGSDLRRVTSYGGGQYAESDPAWSPGGSEIVFWTYAYGIAVVPAAGGTPRQLYHDGPVAWYGAKPVWSPDGSTILFAAQVMPQGSAIWLVAAHGGPAPTPIAVGVDPAWSPDGTSIAFGRSADVLLRAVPDNPMPRSFASRTSR
jgi:Tol biopolymer transport system component